ncbi:hypothetical protein RBWH47_03204 [Rhodopirellula baltica WH47]|uniref:Uncharacterized protein n=1 Tax=Rhodopirellula baltica WH47 TaxID=991778 RepID=F2AT96_RHOBT|nr:hypothetical protein RBWH47_03204 [Rhodopirellula baltica WH47]
MDILRAANGRFLRHRPERSERCLNYEKLYQFHGPLPKSQGVPEGPQRKNHVSGRVERPKRPPPQKTCKDSATEHDEPRKHRKTRKNLEAQQRLPTRSAHRPRDTSVPMAEKSAEGKTTTKPNHVT